MILPEENVVLVKVNADLSARMHELQGRQRKQTEILNGLLTNAIRFRAAFNGTS